MLDTQQIINLCLQRSDRIGRLIPSRKAAGDQWADLMQKAATEHRDAILERVSAEIGDVFKTIEPVIAKVKPKRYADIGCGAAFIDLMIYRRFGCDLVLIDIEESDGIHFGFADSGAGYASLDVARKFLETNGVPAAAITTINPKHQSVADLEPVDMATSLLSCGFHYPASTYDSFFAHQVNKAILLDCRKGRGGEETLASYGTITKVREEKKHDLILCLKTKPVAAKPKAKAKAKSAK